MSIGSRIKDLRRELSKNRDKKCTQEVMGAELGVGRDAISNIEIGRVEPSEDFIKLVCLTYKVRRDWLVNGELPMFPQLDRKAQITQFVTNSMNGEEPTDIQRLLTALMDATPAELEAIANFAQRLAKQYNESKKDGQ